MDQGHGFFQSLAIVICVASATTYLSIRLRQPPVLGYLLAGVIVGPTMGLALVTDQSTITSLSELGVILLMFFLGLEFSLRHLLKVGPRAFIIAFLEVGVMMFAGLSIARGFGFGGLQSLFFGAVVAIASTTIIAKVFEEQNIEKPLRDLVLSILIVEDLLAVILLAVLTMVVQQGEVTLDSLGSTALQLSTFLAVLLLAGMFAVPRMIAAVVKLNRPEVTLLSSVGICFAAVLAAQYFGYSVALGAFLAGSLVAESGEERRVEHLVRPLKDLFSAVFFVAVGMSIDPRMLIEHWSLVLLFTLAVVFVKPLAVAFGAFVGGIGVRRSVRAGMIMSQIGEFSFIIAALGLSLGAVDPALYPVAVTVSAITVLTTPWMVKLSGPLASAVDHNLPKPLQTFVSLYGGWIDDLTRARQRGALGHGAQLRRIAGLLLIDAALLCALVIGTSLGSERLAEWLSTRFPALSEVARIVIWVAAALLVAPLMLTSVRLARALGRRMAQLALPHTTEGVDFAAAPRRAMTLALEIGIVVFVGLLCLLITSPFLPPIGGLAVLILLVLILGIALWRSATNLQGHVQAGSMAILDALGKRAPGAGAGSTALALEQVRELLPGLGDLRPYSVDQDSPAMGLSLGELDLRARTGATVLGLRRNDEFITEPDGETRLLVGDVLVLSGSQHAVREAFDYLIDPRHIDRPRSVVDVG
ncbi:cation:proton antiporter [Pseudomarimonas arenosa]|uniref:Cation:proton antiporter n=1 Tax=Pseudomarimonas arenosa TaxID=2774145 RepID=A0AAW3ZQL8_9GAMM|nr:cation:proton antiporter [Pseudomarimonas arenosa]MBD8527779.1 cation:proton antiporter [Pseudomarimonas arenosa]